MDPTVTEDLERSTLTPICSTWVYTSNAGKARQQSEQEQELTIEYIQTKDYLNISKISDWDHLTDENWHEWKERMGRVFINCDITGYISGDIKWLGNNSDPNAICNWDKNDTWAQQVIIQNVTSSQMNHVGLKKLAEAMYSTLMVTHKNKAHQMVNHIQCLLYETKLRDTEDLLKHLDTLKSYQDCINRFANTDFHISNTYFKAIISISLPS